MNALAQRAASSVEIAIARFARKANGRIEKRDVRELGRRYGSDLHWKFLRLDGDKLALRAPGGFAKSWVEYLGLAFKRERRTPRRASQSFVGHETAHHLAYFFGWLGPSSGMWPGDSLAFDPSPSEYMNGRAYGWRVACASDCPCGRCWRPSTSEVLCPFVERKS